MKTPSPVTIAAMLAFLLPLAAAGERFEAFDRDPGWDGLHNRSEAFAPRELRQDFGYRPASAPNDAAVGGTVTPDGHAAYYAKAIPDRTFGDPVSASGTIEIPPGPGNTLLGFFNAGTVNEWRTPNSIVFRINGRGDVFHVHVEYATAKWRAGASVIGRYDKQADRVYPVEIPGGGVHRWSIVYDPNGQDGAGTITAEFDDASVTFPLSPGHRDDGATFNRFGILNTVKSVDSPGELWIRDLAIDGESVDLAADPAWEGVNNRATYRTNEVRPRFDFGFSATRFAGGDAPGEIGGLFFRGDCRYPEKLAYYGARLEILSMLRPLRASGKVVLKRGVSDSTTLLGFFHSEHSVMVSSSQKSAVPTSFLGLAIEGPSSEGFWVYPEYRVHGDAEGYGRADVMPVIYPDGAPHQWTLEYLPVAAGASLSVSLDKQSVTLPIPPENLAIGAEFNRFGFVTPWIDGNAQVVYIDDLTFTERQ